MVLSVGSLTERDVEDLVDWILRILIDAASGDGGRRAETAGSSTMWFLPALEVRLAGGAGDRRPARHEGHIVNPVRAVGAPGRSPTSPTVRDDTVDPNRTTGKGSVSDIDAGRAGHQPRSAREALAGADRRPTRAGAREGPVGVGAAFGRTSNDIDRCRNLVSVPTLPPFTWAWTLAVAGRRGAGGGEAGWAAAAAITKTALGGIAE